MDRKKMNAAQIHLSIVYLGNINVCYNPRTYLDEEESKLYILNSMLKSLAIVSVLDNK